MERITARTPLRQVRPRELVGLGRTLHKTAVLAQAGQTPSAHLTQLFATCSRRGLRRAAGARHHGRAGRPGARRRRVCHGLATPSWTSCAHIQNNCDDFLLELEAKEKLLTGIPTLRVQFNKVHGSI